MKRGKIRVSVSQLELDYDPTDLVYAAPIQICDK